jgi:hypothetical protein
MCGGFGEDGRGARCERGPADASVS